MSAVETSYGHVLAVQSRILGSALVGDQAAGTAAVVVQDCSDFNDRNGGTVTLNGATYTYAGADVDDDASTITLTPALVADASDGDEIQILDPVLGSPQYESTASVTEDGEDPGDSFEAVIESAVIEQLPEGIRGVAGESVRIAWDEWGQPSVTGIIGVNDNQAGFAHWIQDYATATGNTAVTIHLTYQPVGDSSVKVSWNGIGLDRSEWDFQDPWTILVPAQGFKADDDFEAHYAWTDPAPRPPTPATLTFIGAVSIPTGTTAVTPAAGTQVGDIFIYVGSAGVSFGNRDTTCTDPRVVDQLVSTPNTGHPWPVSQGVAWGWFTTLDPVTVSSFAVDNSVTAYLATYRVTGSVTSETSHGDLTNSSPVPCVPAVQPGICNILVVASDNGGLSAAGWTQDAGGASDCVVWEGANTPAAHVYRSGTSELNTWTALTIGISEG